MTNDEEMVTLLAAALADLRHGRTCDAEFRVLEALVIMQQRIDWPNAPHSDKCACFGSGLCDCQRCRVVRKSTSLGLRIYLLGPCQHANEQGAPML